MGDSEREDAKNPHEVQDEAGSGGHDANSFCEKQGRLSDFYTENPEKDEEFDWFTFSLPFTPGMKLGEALRLIENRRDLSIKSKETQGWKPISFELVLRILFLRKKGEDQENRI